MKIKISDYANEAVTSVMRYFTHFGDTFVSADYFDNRKPRLIFSRIENDMQIALPTKWPALCVREMFWEQKKEYGIPSVFRIVIIQNGDPSSSSSNCVEFKLSFSRRCCSWSVYVHVLRIRCVYDTGFFSRVCSGTFLPIHSSHIQFHTNLSIILSKLIQFDSSSRGRGDAQREDMVKNGKGMMILKKVNIYAGLATFFPVYVFSNWSTILWLFLKQL